jgi:dipeptidyl aminopeptidase/acylaminoacyl peptidase
MKQCGRLMAVVAGVALMIGMPSMAQSQTPYAGYGASSVSEEALAKYAPPPLDPDVSRRIQTLLDVRAPGGGVLSPDGKRLFFGWNITGTPAIWRLDGAKSFPVQLTGGEERTFVQDVTPDGKLLIVGRDVGGQEAPGLYLQPVAGGQLRKVQHPEKVQTVYGFTTKDSKSIYFLSNDIQPTSYALYRFDLGSGTRELVFSEPGLWGIADYRESEDGLKVLLAKATGALSREYFEWDAKTKSLTPLLGQGEKTEYRVQYGAQPGQLFVVSNKLGEFRRLYGWTRDGGLKPISPESKNDVTQARVDQAGKRLYYGVNDGGYQRAFVLDAKTLQPIDLPSIKGADSVQIGDVTADGRFAVIGVSSAQAPRVNYVYDWDTKALTQWALPSAPEVDLATFAVAKLEYYPARDGTQIPMFVRYPAGCADGGPAASPCPVVVDFHGGPEGQATPGFSTYAQAFVDAGFIFVEPNVRGSDGYGKTWLDADNGPKRLDIITDIDDAGKHLRKRWTRNGVAPKIGISGGSYGGYSALIGMTMFAGTYDAGVSIVGVSNLLSFLQNTAPYRRALRASEYGDPEKDADALKKLSPVNYLDRVKAPLLIIQGVDDPRVPAGESIQMQEALAKHGAASQLILLKGEGHGAARRSGQVIMLGNTLRFFEEHLLGKGARKTN